MITHNPEERTGGTMVLYKIISRYSWDKMQARRKACPGSTIEHVMAGTGIYVLHLPAGCARGERAAA